jgi:pimeloyl-ACP methyl ester carboxylesterase
VPEAVAPEVLTSGRETAPTLVFLHDLDFLNRSDYPFISALAQDWRVLLPSHPGFGRSPLPEDFDSVDDLAYFYLDFLREVGPVHLVGAGFGGWIAAEIAIRCTHAIRSLVLVDALGIKIGDRTTTDIKDLFVVSPHELLELCWHDVDLGRRDMPLPLPDRDEETLVQVLTARRTVALMGWNPFLHDPKLLRRLRRIDRPGLVVWGASDRLVDPAYGRAYAQAIPGARFAEIEAAGHYPYLEQPDRFAEVVSEFLGAI